MFNKSNLFYLKLFLVLCFAYGYAVVTGKLVNPDASVVILYLERLNTLSQYFSDLINLQTIDFQPVRDLTFFIDIWFHRNFHINLTIFQNVGIWYLACIVINDILKSIFPDIEDAKRESFVLFFSVYPLFSTTILWGVARKHLLSFLFITMATREFVRNENKKSVFKMGIYYLLSILSQPINILWVLWVITSAYEARKEKVKVYVLSFGPIFMLGFLSNFIYYEKSQIFKLYYHSKTEQMTSFLDKILALGHYSVQLIFPHDLTFLYPLGQWEQMVGIAVFVILPYLLFKMIEDKKFLIRWSVFGILPLAIIINTPNLLMDSYLIVPALALLIFLIKIWDMQDRKRNVSIKVVNLLIVLFVFLNFRESRIWTTFASFTTTAFERHPSCQTAIKAALIMYDKDQKLEPNLRQFLETKNCVTIYHKMTVPQVDQLVRLNSQILYYESGIKFEDKVRSLKNMAKRSEIALFYLAAIYAKEGLKKDLISTVEKMTVDQIPASSRFYEQIIAEVVYPYCKKEKLKSCELKVYGVTKKIDRIWM